MLLETKDRSSVDGNASSVEESAVLLELRADLTNSAEESCLEKLNFIFRIPKFGCLLFAEREVFAEADGAPLGEANSPSSFSFRRRVHLD